jgi:hypothetical protein
MVMGFITKFFSSISRKPTLAAMPTQREQAQLTFDTLTGELNQLTVQRETGIENLDGLRGTVADLESQREAALRCRDFQSAATLKRMIEDASDHVRASNLELLDIESKLNDAVERRRQASRVLGTIERAEWLTSTIDAIERQSRDGEQAIGERDMAQRKITETESWLHAKATELEKSEPDLAHKARAAANGIAAHSRGGLSVADVLQRDAQIESEVRAMRARRAN